MSDQVIFKNSPLGVTANKLNLAFDVGSNAYSETWRWTTKTTDALNSGEVGLNTANWTTATQLNINVTAANRRYMTPAFHALFIAGNKVMVQQKSDPTRYGVYKITAAGTDQTTGWFSFPLGFVESGGVLPAKNLPVMITVMVTGAGISGGPVLDPGTWTTLTLGTGWSGTGQYRLETNGTIKTVFHRGLIVQAAGAAPLAFTLPVAVRPSAARGMPLAGFDATDVVLYHATIGTDGTVTIYPIVRNYFAWPVPANQQNVYLSGLTFSL